MQGIKHNMQVLHCYNPEGKTKAPGKQCFLYLTKFTWYEIKQYCFQSEKIVQDLLQLDLLQLFVSSIIISH